MSRGSPGSRTTKGAPLAYENRRSIAKLWLLQQCRCHSARRVRPAARSGDAPAPPPRSEQDRKGTGGSQAEFSRDGSRPVERVLAGEIDCSECRTHGLSLFLAKCLPGSRTAVASGPPWRLIEQSRRRNGASMHCRMTLHVGCKPAQTFALAPRLPLLHGAIVVDCAAGSGKCRDQPDPKDAERSRHPPGGRRRCRDPIV